MIDRLQSQSGRNHRGVMLVGHGTRDEVGTRQFFELGERLAERLNPQPVVSCLLEFQQPTIPQAWSQLVEQGVEHIDVAPLLLFAAGHAKQDIPQIIAECRRKNPGVSVASFERGDFTTRQRGRCVDHVLRDGSASVIRDARKGGSLRALS